MWFPDAPCQEDAMTCVEELEYRSVRAEFESESEVKDVKK